MPKKWPPYADLGDAGEAERIALIGAHAMAGKLIAFIVETDHKADRYIRLLKRSYPKVVEVWRGPGPVANTVAVKVTSAANAAELRKQARTS